MDWTQETYIRAYRFASLSHLGQKVPGTEISYIQHLSFVSMEVLAAFANETTPRNQELALQCAILHDVIEDTNVTYEEVQAQFGQAVADGVMALTKDKSLEKSEQMRDSLARILQQPQEVWMVKMADRISNLLPPPAYWDAAKCRYYREEALRIHDALHLASPFLSARLLEKIEGYKAYT